MKTFLLFLSLLAAGPVSAQLHFAKTSLDVGKISEDDAPREYVFPYVCEGDKPVVILRVETTCGCAKPRFVKEPVLPGAKGSVSITYYPDGHPGALNRSVYVYTSASQHPVALTLTGTVAPTSDRHPEYPYRIGNLRLKQSRVRFGAVRATSRSMVRVEVLNEGTRTMRLSLSQTPAWLTFSIDPTVIAPDSVGDMIFICDPALLKPGKFSAQIILNGVEAPPSERIMTVSGEVR